MDEMDALAGYGSGSSSSSQDDATNDKTRPEISALSGLVDYSDDEGGSNEVGDIKKESEPATTSSSLSSNKKASPSPKQGNKRKRSWDNAGTDNVLPPPPLSSNASLIQWDTDYTAEYRSPPSSVISDAALAQKLASLDSDSVSWAQHLKSQHEFHNPHFFDSVVTHFGIQRPLDSNLQEPSYQRYEYDLPAAEEQARIRQEQERQEQQTTSVNSNTTNAASQFAQQQFQHAVRRSRGMSM